MSYDQTKLILDVRICLGGISTTKLPDNIITHFADAIDADPDYTGNYPWIYWKSTLESIAYLRTNAITNSESGTRSAKEKVGDVTIDIAYVGAKDIVGAYNDLYNDYASNPEKFGVILVKVQPPVLINGVDAQEVHDYRTNPKTTSTYNPLSASAFPKVTGVASGRRGFRTRDYY